MAPPMSQAMKRAARKGKNLETCEEESKCTIPIENEGQTSAKKQKATNENAPLKTTMKKNIVKKTPKRAPALPREMDVSVTISVGSADISIQLLAKVEEFLEKECIFGLCSIERGGALSRLHMQMVCRLMTSSAANVSKCLKIYLGWEDATKAPIGHHILTKALRNIGLHSYIGMLGYCVKDKGEEHFECVHRNVTSQQIEEGVEEYIKHGTPFAKNRIVLTHTNLIERAATYCRYKMKKQLGSTLPGTLLPMLRSGQYIPSASWVLPVCQGGMEYTRAAALWKCMINPDSIEMEDVTQIFFEHTNPGSRLADLGRQRLAAELSEAREGAAHDYVLPGDVPIHPQPPQNDVIVINGTPDVVPSNAEIPDTDGNVGLHTTSLPVYIPVYFQDHDIHINLLL